MQIETKNVSAVGESSVLETTLLTCASHRRGVLDSPVEAFVAVTDGGGLVMAGAVWRTLGAFSVPSIRLEEARLTSWRKRETEEEEARYTRLIFLMQLHFHQHTHI